MKRLKFASTANRAWQKKGEVDYIDVSTNQAFSIATSLIPFLNHDEAGRALMASNMQKQATPCLIPEAPLVATGIERKAVEDTGRIILAPLGRRNKTC